VLYADHRQARHVKTYTLSARDRELTAGPWSQMNVERGANLLIPVPGRERREGGREGGREGEESKGDPIAYQDE
jgi:hypothetical protein